MFGYDEVVPDATDLVENKECRIQCSTFVATNGETASYAEYGKEMSQGIQCESELAWKRGKVITTKNGVALQVQLS